MSLFSEILCGDMDSFHQLQALVRDSPSSISTANLAILTHHGCAACDLDNDVAEAARLAEPVVAGLRAASEAGDGDAMCVLAVLLRDGIGVSRDMSESRRLLELCVERGHVRGQYELGRWHSQGQGQGQGLGVEVSTVNEEEEEEEAYRLYRLSADHGYAAAERVVGLCLREEKNYEEALYYLRRAWMQHKRDSRQKREITVELFEMLHEELQGVQDDGIVGNILTRWGGGARGGDQDGAASGGGGGAGSGGDASGSAVFVPVSPYIVVHPRGDLSEHNYAHFLEGLPRSLFFVQEVGGMEYVRVQRSGWYLVMVDVCLVGSDEHRSVHLHVNGVPVWGTIEGPRENLRTLSFQGVVNLMQDNTLLSVHVFGSQLYVGAREHREATFGRMIVANVGGNDDPRTNFLPDAFRNRHNELHIFR